MGPPDSTLSSQWESTGPRRAQESAQRSVRLVRRQPVASSYNGQLECDFFFWQRWHPPDDVTAGEVDHPAAAKIHLLVVAVVLGRVIAADVPVAEAQHVADRVQLLIDDRIRHGEEIGERLIMNRAYVRVEVRHHLGPVELGKVHAERSL